MGDQFGNDVKQSRLAQEFIVDFVSKKDDLISKIETLKGCNDFQEQLSLLSKEIQKLSKSLHDSITFLPSYSIKKRQEEIRNLEKLFKDKEAVLVPKRKFGFKAKIRQVIHEEPNISEAKTREIESKENVNTMDAIKMDSNFVTIEDIQDKNIIYEEKELDGADVMVRNLEGTIVQLRGTPSTLRITGLKDCKLVCGPVQTSVFIDNCTNCKLYLCCQQLRTHSSHELEIYLRVRARAIIEDCTGIRFAPYSYPHNKSYEWHQRVNMDPNLERFDCVDDFNWLSDTQSPNWSVMPEDQRENFPI
ncbi:unnamed protein product [Allacma fusca]|uniref:C-CAP/cofactor C-like domain-containing protein n=1 Tax=Allacma fusca TaxID=39272 RepID=A0A8J2KTU5_9HEXA|nr:unnamed protein product [Allacma fusca]